MKKLKYTFLVMGVMVFLGPVMAQNKVSIRGELTGYSPKAVIYFMYADIVKQQQITDSVRLKNGKFEKSISISEPTQLGVIMSAEGKSLSKFTAEEKQAAEAITFYVDKGDFNLKFDGTFRKFKMDTPKQIVTDFKAYNAILTKDRQAIIDSINIHYAKDGKINDNGTISVKAEQVEDYKQAVVNAEQKAMNNVLVFAKAHTSSYIGLLALLSCFNMQRSLASQLSEMLNDYTTELQNTTLGKKLRLEFEANR